MDRRTSLVQVVTDRLLSRIVSGEFPEGSALPPEDELAAQSGASRLTVREAVRVLASQQVLRPVQGRGTFVGPADQWTSLEALIAMRKGDAAQAVVQLVEVRAMVEVGAAELFAPLCSAADLATLEGDLDDMRSAHARADVAGFVAADLRFHDRILQGCGNPFVPATFQPIARALHAARERTSSVPAIREHAIADHGGVIAALRVGTSAAARAAMRKHLRQTRDDALQHLTTGPSAAG